MTSWQVVKGEESRSHNHVTLKRPFCSQLTFPTTVSISAVKRIGESFSHVKIIDTRPSYIFNGWTVGQEYGGHITGALNFCSDWVTYSDKHNYNNDGTTCHEEPNYDVLKIQLIKMNIVNKNDILVLYGSTQQENNNLDKYIVFDKLKQLGFKTIIFIDNKDIKTLFENSKRDNLSFNHTNSIRANMNNFKHGCDNGEVTTCMQKQYKLFEKEEFEIVQVEKYDRLVHPHWLYNLVNNVNNFGKYLMFETDWNDNGLKSFNKHHIIGAQYMDTNDFEDEKPIWNRKCDKDIESYILSYGITCDTMVILYDKRSYININININNDDGDDDISCSVGKCNFQDCKAQASAAFRIGVILQYAGVKDVRILDGGYQSWLNCGYPVESSPFANRLRLQTTMQFGAKIPSKSDYIVDMRQVKSYVTKKSKNEKANLISIRSIDEHIGKTSGYPYFDRKGRIFNDIYGSDINSYRNIDGTMLCHEIIENKWNKCGMYKNNNVKNIFYCGTGWRASETLFYAYMMNWKNIALYDGGWYEWSNDKTNPIELGAAHSSKL